MRMLIHNFTCKFAFKKSFSVTVFGCISIYLDRVDINAGC
jgi:hypothetical protein